MTLKQNDLIKFALGCVVAIGLASTAIAKGHDQGQTATPGSSVQTETVGPAQGLGTAVGNRGDNGPF